MNGKLVHLVVHFNVEEIAGSLVAVGFKLVTSHQAHLKKGK
jgi:hypothetical protein